MTEGSRTISGDFDTFSKLSGFAVDLYAIMKEFLKVCAVKDAITSRT